ncbi:MAG: hypothetical protein Fur0034_20150 [Desulfuromonadia bacterium]
MPGDLVCGDITPLDIPVLREDGSTAYARLISWHDMATNWLWVDPVLLEKGQGIRREHVAASYARMCEKAPFGAPRRLYLDNGSEYQWDEMLVACKRLAEFTGQQFAAEEAATTPAERQVVRSIPFRPRGKRIEGLFGNLTDWLGWWFGYVGGNRITKKVATLGKGVQPARFDDVKDWLNRTLADYHVTPQAGAEHMGGLSPQQKLTQALEAGWRPWKIDRITLALAFADYEPRLVSRGTVSVGGVTYAGDCLMAIEGRVMVAVPRILGEEGAYILDADGRRILGWVEPERVYAITDQAGAKEAGRRRQALRLLLAERIAQAGGPLDEAALADHVVKLAGAGMPIPQWWVREKFGIPEAKDGEPVLGAAAAPGPTGEPLANRVANQAQTPGSPMAATPDVAVATPDVAPAVHALHATNCGCAAHATPPSPTGRGAGGEGEDPTPITAMADRMEIEAEAAWTAIMDRVRHIVEGADSLPALRDALLSAFADLPEHQLAEVMAMGFAAAELAGRFAAREESE